MKTITIWHRSPLLKQSAIRWILYNSAIAVSKVIKKEYYHLPLHLVPTKGGEFFQI